MKPKYVKESLRVTTTYKSDTPNKYQAFFEISQEGSIKNKWLVLQTTSDYKKAIGYVIKNDNGCYGPVKDGDFLLCKENSWQNELLRLCNIHGYSTSNFKTFYLAKERFVLTASSNASYDAREALTASARVGIFQKSVALRDLISGSGNEENSAIEFSENLSMGGKQKLLSISQYSMFVSTSLACPSLMPTCGLAVMPSGEVLGSSSEEKNTNENTILDLDWVDSSNTSLGLKFEEKLETSSVTFAI